MKCLLHLSVLRLTEQPTKPLYLAISLAAVVLAWMLLSTFASPALLSNSSAITSELWLANARAQNTPFPLRHIPRIQQIPGVDKMHWFTAAAFFCADGSGTTVTVTGWDGDIADRFREKGASAANLAAWQATEHGVLVGADIARQCGLTPGMTIRPHNIFGEGDIPLYVVAVLSEEEGRHEHVNAHYSYVNRLMAGHLGAPVRDTAFRAMVTVRDPSRLDQVAQAIEQEFQSSDPPLEATVLGDNRSLLGRFGQVQALLLFIIGALVLCVLLVFVAMTAHLVAQRRSSMAILQTLGFNRRIQWFGLMLELMCVLAVGTALGVAAGYGGLALLTPWAAAAHLGKQLHPIDGAIVVLIPALLVLLMVSLVWPAVQIRTLRPIDFQRV